MTPRWLRLLGRLLPRDAREEVLRELTEQHQRVAARGRWARTRWAWRQLWAVTSWRDERVSTGWLRGLGQDWRVARRGLRQRPAVGGTVILTVAVCIASTTAIAAIVDGVLLRPLPYPDEARMVWLATYQPSPTSPPFDPAGAAGAFANPMDVADWAARERTLASVTAFETFEGTVIAGGRPVRVGVASLSATVGTTLGIRAHMGRLFVDDDLAPGVRVAVLSHRLWRSAFQSDPAIVNGTIDLGGTRFVVLGVLPDLRMMFPADNIDVWLPLAPPAADFANRFGVWQRVVARMDPGTTLAQASQDMTRVARELETAHPKSNADRRLFVVPYREGLVGRTRSVIGLLAGAMVLVLMIATANVGNLLLVSAQGRQREFAVRAALGAEPRRVIRLLAVESTWLCLVGGAAGLALAPWALQGLLAVYPETLPSVGVVRIGWPAAGVALLATVAASVLTVIPAIVAARRGRIQEALRSSERAGEQQSQRRVRAGLVVLQVALSTALLVGGGLLLRTFFAMRATDVGVQPQGVMTFNIALSPVTYDTLEDEVRFYDSLLERVRVLPEVEHAGMSTLLPFAPGEFGDGFTRVGFNDVPPDIPVARLQNISVGYLEALGVPLKRGRGFTADDTAGTLPVALVNETLERRDFPEGALGRQIRFRGVVHEIVGVVGDKRHRSLRERPRAEMYYPRAQVAHPRYLGWVAVRTSGDPATLVPELRRVVASIDPTVAIDDVSTLDRRVQAVLAPDRFRATLVAGLAVIALLLAGIGLYGLVAHTVARDQRMIAIRMALGAPARRAAGRVVAQVCALTLGGVGCGALLAWAGHSLVSGFLAGVDPLDPLTLGLVGCALALVALAAAAGPAWRAGNVDPAEVLRSQ
ncbi:MAG: ABC transporter permease [Vicinamibacterales bacterium]